MAGNLLYFLHRNAKVLFVLACIAAAGVALVMAKQLLALMFGA